MSVEVEKTKTVTCKCCGKAITLHWKVQPKGPLIESEDIGERLSGLVKYCDPCGDFFWGMREFRRNLGNIASTIMNNPDNGEKFRRRLTKMMTNMEQLVAKRFHCRVIPAGHLVDSVIKNPQFAFESVKEYLDDIQTNMDNARPRTNDD